MLNLGTLPSTAAVAEQPSDIAPLMHDGKYSPGEFAWVRGAYNGATPAERATYLRIASWATECLQKAKAQLKSDLTARGYPNAAVDNLAVGPLLCRELAIQPLLEDHKDLQAFATASARATLVSEGFLAAVSLVDSVARVGVSTPGEFLRAQTLSEQVLRQATNSGSEMIKATPRLTQDEQVLVLARISVAIAEHDHENTELLKSIVAEKGWPKISEFGADGARAAWLLAQHADGDPIFQLEALKKMEPLVATGEVTKQDYAYLYDRVFLKLTGRQRYGTQASCSKTIRVPQPLEDPARVDALRKELGLSPEAEYLEQMNRTLGPCAPTP